MSVKSQENIVEKVYLNKKCDDCGFEGKVIETFGRKYCKTCWDKKPKKGNGHSGMLRSDNMFFDFIDDNKELCLLPVPKGNKMFSTWYLEHYPKSKGIVGRQLNYFIQYQGRIVGIIGVNSPPLNFKKFRSYFQTENEKLFVNNNVFRIVHTEKNLGTKCLKLLRNTIQKDYFGKYKDNLIGIITFVEPPRTGAVYKADNWDYLGITQGKHCSRQGDHGKWINKEWSEGTKKYIFAKKLKCHNNYVLSNT